MGNFSALKIEAMEQAPEIEQSLVKNWEIDPDNGQKNDVIDQILMLVGKPAEMGPSKLFRYRLVMDEALTNSVTHGTPDGSSGKIKVALHMDENCWVIRIEDDGPGFELGELPDITDPELQFAEHGRGILILERYTRRVVYADHGRNVTIWMENEKS